MGLLGRRCFWMVVFCLSAILWFYGTVGFAGDQPSKKVKQEESSDELSPITIDGFVKSWFMPRAAAYEVRRGAEPDTLFQTLSKYFGGDGRLFGV